MTRRKIWICCEEAKRKDLEERANRVYEGVAEFMDHPGKEVERVIVVLPETAEMKKALQSPEIQGKLVIRVDEQFFPLQLYRKLLQEELVL